MLFERIKLEEDEELVQVVRKHWWIIAVETTGIVVAVFLPWLITKGVLWIFSANQLQLTANLETVLATYQPEILFLYILWVLALWIMLANFWTDYYLDLWAITTRRVVLVDQRGFFHRFISSFRLERLQDMNIEVSGVIPTLLDYGTIEAQTAGGSQEDFTSTNMPKPRDIKATIVRCADELTHDQAAKIQTLKEQGL